MRKKLSIMMPLCLLLLSTSISFCANAEGKITQEAIAAVMSMYNLSGSNKYWTYDSTVSGASTAWTGSDHYASSSSSGQWRQYDSGDYFTGWQCYGFAEFMGWAVTGGTSKNDVPLRSSNWTKYSSKSAYLAAGGLEVGDIIHYWNGSIGHSVMIYEVLSNGKFKVVEALGSSGNKINWGWVEGYESHSTLSYFDNNKGAWQYGLKYKGSYVIQPETYTNLEFRDVVYPARYKVGSSGGWYLQGGTLVSNYELKTISTRIEDFYGNIVSKETTYNISGNSYNIKNLDTFSSSDNGVAFSNITEDGQYHWILTATDSAGRTLELFIGFLADDNYTTTTPQTISKAFVGVDSITLTQLDTLYIGETQIIISQVEPANAQNPLLRWTIDNPDIAQIEKASDNAIYLKGLKMGEATLTAFSTDGSGVSSSQKITVINNITSVTASMRERVGEDEYINFDVHPVKRGDIFWLYVYWTYTFPPDSSNWQFRTDSRSGLTYLYNDEGVMNNSGIFYAENPGVFNVYFDLYENGQLIPDACITIPIQVYELEVLTSPDLVLPAALKTVEDEAFEGLHPNFNNVIRIKLPEGLEEIGARAFANCGSLEIYIPESVTSISDSAFSGTAVTIVGHQNSNAQIFADNHYIEFIQIAEESEISDWVLASEAPENAEIVQTKTQYSFRERGEAFYTEWSDWGSWSKNKQTITDSDLMQEESRPSYAWWAAKCKNCGRHNPYSNINCKNCGKSLNNMWESVFAYTTDLSMGNIDGRPDGKYVDGKPYWRSSSADDRTEYRYRTRELTYSWGDWSSWSDMPATVTETREVRTRTMVRYEIN